MPSALGSFGSATSATTHTHEFAQAASLLESTQLPPQFLEHGWPQQGPVSDIAKLLYFSSAGQSLHFLLGTLEIVTLSLIHI